MEQVIKIVAPRNIGDFAVKLLLVLLLCGWLNHLRDIALHGAAADPYIANLGDAVWTALPMCAIGLWLIQYLNHLQQRLYLQATTDQLTEIPNRRWFMARCGAKLHAGAALVLLDVDHFKNVNDTHGHAIGDRSLKAVVDHILAQLPDQTKCARLGGEEFGILFDKMDETVMARIQAICAGFKLTLPDHTTIRLTVSAGVYAVQRVTDFQAAYRLADAALYRAKDAGRAQCALERPAF